MIALIPLFPLLGFVINASLGRRLPKTVSGGLASLAMLASFAVSLAIVWQLASLRAGAARHRADALYLDRVGRFRARPDASASIRCRR